MTTQLEQAWELAKQRFAAVGIDVEEALRQLDRLPVSMHCWQGDDVSGFENPEGSAVFQPILVSNSAHRR